MAKRESLKKLTADLGERKLQKWPKDRVDALAQDMLDWWRADDQRITWAEFWAQRDDITYYRELPVYLGNRSETFAHIHARCQLIQESRLVNRGLQPKVNPTFMMFLLVNIGGYSPINGVNIKNDNRRVELPSVQLQVGQSPAKGINDQSKTIDVDGHQIPPIPPLLGGKSVEDPAPNTTEEP